MCLQLGGDVKCTFIMGRSQKRGEIITRTYPWYKFTEQHPRLPECTWISRPHIMTPWAREFTHFTSTKWRVISMGESQSTTKHFYCISISNTNHWIYHSCPFARTPETFRPVYVWPRILQIPTTTGKTAVFQMEGLPWRFTDSVSTIFPCNIVADVASGSTVYQRRCGMENITHLHIPKIMGWR